MSESISAIVAESIAAASSSTTSGTSASAIAGNIALLERDIAATRALAKRKASEVEALERLVAKERCKYQRCKIEEEGVYRFSDGIMADVFKVAGVWRKIGTVNGGLDAEGECREDGCDNERCRFAPEGVMSKKMVPLYHFMNSEHTLCLTLCGYCRPLAIQILEQTRYWNQHKDDGYGGPTDWYKTPFCVLPCSRVRDENDRARLAQLCVKPPEPVAVLLPAPSSIAALGGVPR